MPIGLFVLSLLFDVASYIGMERWFYEGALYTMALGIVTAGIAAIPGLVDYSDIRSDHPAKRTATAHLVLNVVVVALYAVDAWLRYQDMERYRPTLGCLMLSLVAMAVLSVSGYLGGRLVYADGIAVGRHRRPTPMPPKTREFEVTADEMVEVGRASELEEGGTLRVAINGHVMAVVKLNRTAYAFQEFCTHRFGPLSEGTFDGVTVMCPWHRSCFNVRDGKVEKGPAKEPLKTFETKVDEGRILVRAPRK